jgi:hypothetical protein
LANGIKELYKHGSKKWVKEKAQKLKNAAALNPFQETLYKSHLLSMSMYIDMLLQYKKSIYQS